MAFRVLRPRCPCRAPAPVFRVRHDPLSGRAVVGGAPAAPAGVQAPCAGCSRAPSAFFRLRIHQRTSGVSLGWPAHPNCDFRRGGHPSPLSWGIRYVSTWSHAPEGTRPRWRVWPPYGGALFYRLPHCVTLQFRSKLHLRQFASGGRLPPSRSPRVFFMVLFWLRQLPPQSAILPRQPHRLPSWPVGPRF